MKRMLIVFSVLLFCFVGIVDFCEAEKIVVSVNQNTEADLAGYRVYYGSDYNAVAAKQVEPINLIGRATNCVCLIVDENIMSVLYIGVSAYNTDDKESELTMGYYLFGNIAGDFNDGTQMSGARVDGLDLTTLGLYFSQTVTHPTYNCSDCAAIRAIPLPTDLQKCDSNKDGRIDGFDLIELGLRFGNAAQ